MMLCRTKQLSSAFITIILLAVLGIMYTVISTMETQYGFVASSPKTGAADLVLYSSKLQTHSTSSVNLRGNGSADISRLACKSSEYKSWTAGTVTRIQPHIDASCELLWNNTETEVYRVKTAVKKWKNAESDEQFMRRMTDCSTVMEEFTGNFYVSQEEVDFPLAFSLVVYTAPQQVIRLLKTIYRPHNLYCIHPDEKRSETFINFFANFSSCLDNVFVASRPVGVFYAHVSILEAQLHCMEDLITFNRSRWRYAVNLVGRELPLATNRDIVKTLKRLNDVSSIRGELIPTKFVDERFTYKFNLKRGKIHNTYIRLPPVPHNITIYKGITHIAITRPFMEFILKDKIAVDFRNYLQDVRNPEESFFASLFHLPEAAKCGGYKEGVRQRFMIEKPIWLNSPEAKEDPSNFCSGKNVHNVCVVASGDLHRIGESYGKVFFFNKYFMEWDNVIADCAEEKLVQRNREEYRSDCLI